MPVTTIKELRILPALAIGRFGSSPEPLENYTAQIVDPLDFRKIVPAPTLIVDDATGTIARETNPGPQDKVHFRDAKRRIKPLAPFLEVWARFDDDDTLVPLTKNHLAHLGMQPSNLTWMVEVANIKVFRRTGDPLDKVVARLQIAFDQNDPDQLHRASPLLGQCKYFKPANTPLGVKTIPFGAVRYLRPTDAFPEIRFRFTPAAGRVYGTRAGDPLITDDVYAGVTALPAPLNGPWSPPFAGTWDRYWIGAPHSPPVTAPGDIFQGQQVGQTKVSDGYFDDTCDGTVEVRLRVGATTLSAFARIMSGVPDFAPDSRHVRTISDDLEQMALGPNVSPPATPAEEAQIKADVVDTIRRAYETVRLMNTMVMNGDQNVGDVQRNGNNMPGQQSSYGRAREPIYETTSGSAAYTNALGAHRRALQHALNSPKLVGSFTQIGLVRPYDEVGDLHTEKRRRMPAMMRGSDGLEMALTRRQYAKLALAAAGPAVAAAPFKASVRKLLVATVLPARTLVARSKATHE
jgi:hypothetical protein